MELGLGRFRGHDQIHGISRNFECANFDDESSSIEFHGTWSVSISMTRAVPWKFECANFDDTSSSMEFHGTSLVIIDRNFKVAWILVELEACIIPNDID